MQTAKTINKTFYDKSKDLYFSVVEIRQTKGKDTYYLVKYDGIFEEMHHLIPIAFFEQCVIKGYIREATSLEIHLGI